MKSGTGRGEVLSGVTGKNWEVQAGCQMCVHMFPCCLEVERKDGRG